MPDRLHAPAPSDPSITRPRRLNLLAALAFSLSAIATCYWLIAYMRLFGELLGGGISPASPETPLWEATEYGPLLALLSLFLGIVSLSVISRSKLAVRGRWLARFAIALSIPPLLCEALLRVP
jgi:hypothetical protein